MNRRHIVMTAALAVMFVLAALVIQQRTGAGAAPGSHAVRLASGATHRGELLQVREASYLLQTGSGCLILSPAEIREVDGNRVTGPEVPVAGRVPSVQETFEEISPTGEIELYSTIRAANGSSGVLTEVNWGIAPHEIPQLEHYRVRDAFGVELPIRVEDDPAIHGKRLRVTLARPALPGEEVALTCIIGRWSTASREGGNWVYRVRGDYPDDRLVTRAVRLPAGARILSVQPEPLQTTASDGRQVVIWRRYFTRGEVYPWEIRYSL